MGIHRRKDKIDNEPKWPWHRRAGESEREYTLFTIYRNMGPKRSIRAMAREMLPSPSQKTGRFSGTYAQKCATDQKWQIRARAWDNFVQEAKDRKLRDELVKWEKRRLAHLDESFEMAELMKTVGKEMLATPIVQTIEEQDGKLIIHNPGKWSFQTAVDMIKASVEIKTAVLTAVDDPNADVDDETVKAIQDAHYQPDDLKAYLDEAEAVGPVFPPDAMDEDDDSEASEGDLEVMGNPLEPTSSLTGEPHGHQDDASSDSDEIESP